MVEQGKYEAAWLTEVGMMMDESKRLRVECSLEARLRPARKLQTGHHVYERRFTT